MKRGGDANRLKESLCVAYIKEKNVEKVEELTKTGTFAEAIYHDIINMHIDLGNTELALNHFERIRSIRPTFKLTRKDAGRLGHLMFKEDREWSEIIRVFIENRQQPIRSDDWNTKEIHFFLEAVANTRNPGELSELFDVLHANNFLIKDSHVAGFMIKAHLKNEDLPNAVGTFEKQFAENKFTSNYLPLMVALLVANDMEGLEKVFKCMQLKYSNGDAVLALVTAFIEIGNLELARVVLNHSASLITDNDFRQHCARCSMFGRHAMLENLISATEGLGYDRSIIYSSLLAHYCAKNQVDQALELWRRQISKNEEPSNDFMIALASCLKKNSLNVPFEVPKPKLKQEEGAGKNAAARSEKVDAALKRWEIAYPKSVRYIYLTSNLYQSLSESKEAAVTEIKLIQVKRRVFDDALRDLVLRLDNDGEIELLERLGNALPTPAKRSIHFGLLLLKAYEKADKWDEFFSLTLAKKRKNLNINDRIPMEDLLVRLQKQSIPLNQCRLRHLTYPFERCTLQWQMPIIFS